MAQAQIKAGSYSLTQEQVMFFAAQKRIRELQQKDDPASLEEIQRIQEKLWKSIWRFAKSEINRMMGVFSTEDERNDVEQDCAVKFFSKLPSYDPLRATPTTFFVRYFKEAISDNIRRNHTKLSQYDAANSRKIKAAIAAYEAQGIEWSIDMLATKTGLSQKVVKATLYYSTNAKIANIDETPPLISSILSPEEAYQEKENNRALYDAIFRNITPLEKNILMLRVNINGSKKMPYDKIAERTGLPIRKVKSILNGAICKLNQDESLRHQFGERNTYHTLTPIQMQDDSIDTVESDILEVFG